MRVLPHLRRVFLAVALTACQSDQTAEPQKAPAVARTDDAYRTDIQKVCDSMALSGADKLAKLERVAPHSKWLGENLTTRDAQQFLIQMKQLPSGDAKADALEAEAKRVGLTGGCALAAEFR